MRLLWLTIIWMISCSVSAGIYKWVDKDGQVHYGEKPPENQKSKQMRLRSSGSENAPPTKSTDTSTRLERQKKLLRSFEEERKQKQAQRDKEEKQAAQRKRNCAIARDNLRQYEATSRVYKLDDKGNRIFLPDSAREESIRRSRADVKKWCGK